MGKMGRTEHTNSGTKGAESRQKSVRKIDFSEEGLKKSFVNSIRAGFDQLYSHPEKEGPAIYDAEYEGGLRFCFVANWGLTGKVSRLIKADKPLEFIQNERTKYAMEHGSDTENECIISEHLRPQNAQSHHITAVLDSKDLPIVDHISNEIIGQTIVSVGYYVASTNLEDYIKREGTLDDVNFQKIFSHVLDAASYMVEKKVYHRDIKPSNILVAEAEDSDLGALLTDLANARKFEDIKDNYDKTGGSRLITDPLTMDVFNEIVQRHNVTSEIYSIGMTMLYSLIGYIPLEYQPNVSQPFAASKHGHLLLDPSGNIDPDRHADVFKPYTQEIENNKFFNMIMKCLTLDYTKRYDSMSHFVDHFETLTDKKIRP